MRRALHPAIALPGAIQPLPCRLLLTRSAPLNRTQGWYIFSNGGGVPERNLLELWRLGKNYWQRGNICHSANSASMLPVLQSPRQDTST